MKKIAVFVIAIIMLSGLFACAGGGEDVYPDNHTFTVMTFNIRIIGAEDRPDKLWDYRREDVIALIKRHSPDIIGMQEVKDIQYEYLTENLGEYGFYGINGWDGHPFSDIFGGANVVFYKKERFEAVGTRTLWMSETPEVRSQWEDSDIRTLTEVKLRDKLTGDTLTFIATHLSTGKPGQHKGTLMLKDIADQTEGGLIIVGDFNYQQGTDDYLEMISGTLKDSMTLTADGDSGGTFHSFNGTVDKPWPKPIDFIFITNGYFSPLSSKIIRDQTVNGTYPSDHFPVKTVLEYKRVS